jgi:hypothetical protein
MTGRLLRRPPNNSPPKHRNHASYNRVKKIPYQVFVSDLLTVTKV